jgi:hypothetical protein
MSVATSETVKSHVQTRQGRQRGGKAFSKASLHHLLTTSCTRARSVTRRKAGARDAEDAGVDSVGTSLTQARQQFIPLIQFLTNAASERNGAQKLKRNSPPLQELTIDN